MNIIANLPANQRKELFAETASRKGVLPAIIEKDFWVCWVLSRLFASSNISNKILFKGGTSLSKVFKLIERFSEDIDLILDWNEVTQDNPCKARSKTQQDRFNKDILEKGRYYLHDHMLPEVSTLLSDLCKVEMSDDMPDVIKIRYPAAFSESYLRPEIHLEIGPLALWCPNAAYKIQPYAAEEFPDLFKQAICKVKVVTVERTFWEKATILHHESHRPQLNVQPQRYSRHYYDMARMAKSSIKDIALKRMDLLKSVVEFKDKFYPRGWARYDLAVPGSFKLIPPSYILKALERDYTAMRIMIYGQVPEFSQIIQTLSKLENEINQLKHS